MRYANEDAFKAFHILEDYETPLAMLELSFKGAGLDIEFVCAIAADGQKIVSIYRGGFLYRQQSIECDSPAQAVKDVVAGVRL
ncbi:MAG: hypothetical protein LBU85_12685 [Treponema sp.]|jgi:hypothetical protein|nr:hypothetical protein [Treponema sp.]